MGPSANFRSMLSAKPGCPLANLRAANTILRTAPSHPSAAGRKQFLLLGSVHPAGATSILSHHKAEIA
jgi:hypothetical protein